MCANSRLGVRWRHSSRIYVNSTSGSSNVLRNNVKKCSRLRHSCLLDGDRREAGESHRPTYTEIEYNVINHFLEIGININGVNKARVRALSLRLIFMRSLSSNLMYRTNIGPQTRVSRQCLRPLTTACTVSARSRERKRRQLPSGIDPWQ